VRLESIHFYEKKFIDCQIPYLAIVTNGALKPPSPLWSPESDSRVERLIKQRPEDSTGTNCNGVTVPE